MFLAMQQLTHLHRRLPGGPCRFPSGSFPATFRCRPNAGIAVPDASYGQKRPIYALYSRAKLSILLVTHRAHRSPFTGVTCIKARYFYAPVRHCRGEVTP